MSENKAKKLPQYIAAVSICIGALGAGTALGWSSNITQDLKKGKLNDFMMNDEELSWAGSSMTLGAMLMCLPIGFISDAIGRKPAVLLTVFPFVLGWLLIIFSRHVAMIYVGRVLTGIAGGSFCVTAPLYTSEIAETEIRGRLGTFFHLFLTVGVLLAEICGYALPMMGFHYLMLSVPIAFAIAFFFMPETPVYLMRKGKTEKMKKAFKFLRGKKYDYSEEVSAIEKAMAEEAKMAGFWDTMKTKASKKAALLCLMLMFYQQFSGVVAILFFLNEIFTSAGSSLDAHYCVVIFGIVEVTASVVSAIVIDKLGRRLLLIISFIFMSISTFILGLFFTFKDRDLATTSTLHAVGFIPLMALMLFIIAFCLGVGPIAWMGASELFAPQVIAICGSIAATFNWFIAFLVTKFFLTAANGVGGDVVFYIFSFLMFTGIFFTYFLMPETKGKLFDEISKELEGTAES